ncbi:MAG: hypothetical protein ABEH86_10810 [Haloarcula sp.]
MSIAETTADPATVESEETTADESEVDEEFTRDDLFHVLQCRRRRLVLKYLYEYPGDKPANMSDIAEHIAALEHDTTVDALRSKERQRVYIALYQSHLPKMDDAGVINYNQDRGLVEATELTKSFDGYLIEEPSILSSTTPETNPDPVTKPATKYDGTNVPADESWSNRYLGAACGTLIAVTWLALSGISVPLVSGVGLTIVVGVVLFVLALSHLVTTLLARR